MRKEMFVTCMYMRVPFAFLEAHNVHNYLLTCNVEVWEWGEGILI